MHINKTGKIKLYFSSYENRRLKNFKFLVIFSISVFANTSFSETGTVQSISVSGNTVLQVTEGNKAIQLISLDEDGLIISNIQSKSALNSDTTKKLSLESKEKRSLALDTDVNSSPQITCDFTKRVSSEDCTKSIFINQSVTLDLKDTNMALSKFTSSSIENSSVKKSYLGDSSFVASKVSGSSFSDTNMELTTFTNARFYNVRFTNTNFTYTNFTNVTFRNTTFKNVNFKGATLTNVDFSDTNLSLNALSNSLITNIKLPNGVHCLNNVSCGI